MTLHICDNTAKLYLSSQYPFAVGQRELPSVQIASELLLRESVSSIAVHSSSFRYLQEKKTQLEPGLCLLKLKEEKCASFDIVLDSPIPFVHNSFLSGYDALLENEKYSDFSSVARMTVGKTPIFDRWGRDKTNQGMQDGVDLCGYNLLLYIPGLDYNTVSFVPSFVKELKRKKHPQKDECYNPLILTNPLMDNSSYSSFLQPILGLPLSQSFLLYTLCDAVVFPFGIPQDYTEVLHALFVRTPVLSSVNSVANSLSDLFENVHVASSMVKGLGDVLSCEKNSGVDREKILLGFSVSAVADRLYEENIKP